MIPYTWEGLLFIKLNQLCLNIYIYSDSALYILKEFVGVIVGLEFFFKYKNALSHSEFLLGKFLGPQAFFRLLTCTDAFVTVVSVLAVPELGRVSFNPFTYLNWT